MYVTESLQIELEACASLGEMERRIQQAGLEAMQEGLKQAVRADTTRLDGQLPAVAGARLSGRQRPGGMHRRRRHQSTHEKTRHALEECHCQRGCGSTCLADQC
ncbi:MAG TPA: hypothetical protein VED37_01110 [Ktedonobacteraceae bacterium]|nr:hypothetical protein [Ktedonobacteraceae bacterium]